MTRGRALLHSATVDGDLGRASYAASDPDLTFEAHGTRIRLRDRTGAVIDERITDPLTALADLLARHDRGAAPGSPLAPFAIGWLGYDLGRTIEHLGPG
ncbi:MAG TPA: hypothetical protein VL172_04110, partial [Kofleriaceae bacterium]|nr:hypothetical protein [Kofleriaceae bacterium]